MNTVQVLSDLATARDLIDGAIEAIAGAPSPWSYPVGDERWPTERWYAATLHDTTGRLNDGYAHTGIDLNMWKAPWGDVDRGKPVFAVADGVVDDKGYSTSYLGSVILLVEHLGQPLYVRYWHLENDAAFDFLQVGERVNSGELIGRIGNYTLGAGGDHLHLDMALDPFGPHWWFTRHPAVRWVDPVPILKAHLDADKVDAMLRRD
jgi:murein DD-endopeptidase MepM/ murein hydrolase activator NlpD